MSYPEKKDKNNIDFEVTDATSSKERVPKSLEEKFLNLIDDIIGTDSSKQPVWIDSDEKSKVLPGNAPKVDKENLQKGFFAEFISPLLTLIILLVIVFFVGKSFLSFLRNDVFGSTFCVISSSGKDCSFDGYERCKEVAKYRDGICKPN